MLFYCVLTYLQIFKWGNHLGFSGFSFARFHHVDLGSSNSVTIFELIDVICNVQIAHHSRVRPFLLQYII
jgi:hypothetical protein